MAGRIIAGFAWGENPKRVRQNKRIDLARTIITPGGDEGSAFKRDNRAIAGLLDPDVIYHLF
jgi:hypothetical protein